MVNIYVNLFDYQLDDLIWKRRHLKENKLLKITTYYLLLLYLKSSAETIVQLPVRYDASHHALYTFDQFVPPDEYFYIKVSDSVNVQSETYIRIQLYLKSTFILHIFWWYKMHAINP